MSETELNRLWNPALWLVLKVWFYGALFGTVLWQFGASTLLIVLAWIVIGVVVSLLQKVMPRWQGKDKGLEENEQVLSADSTEAKTARHRITSQLTVGLGCYLLFVSSILAGVAGAPFWIVLGAVSSGMVFTAVLFLVWATTWSLSSRSRWNQFSISTLMLLTAVSAIYLSVIRLLADMSGEQLGAEEQSFLVLAGVCFVLAGFSLPFLLIYMEHFIWLAAWFVRLPLVQGWLRERRFTPPPSSVEDEGGERQ